eukprot:TRINITY_DN459_c0_g1_i3.p1 TRINITY_DN459_c0_g1~~TRINITY_DN459_c0_g1_i3.p1  ORF type:complete len:252 (-),score=72.89 TRINITY_DN459_c0_g1_i3:34-762(-)
MSENVFKTVLVTGASRGIGLELVTQFLENRKVEKIFATTRSKSEKLEQLKLKYPNQLEIIYLDVSNLETVKKGFEIVKNTISSLDLLINNAGIAGTNFKDSLVDLKNSEFLDVFNTNVIGVLNVTNTFFPLFNKESKTLIINISSRAGSLTSSNNDSITVPYKVSKAALNMLTKNYSLEFGNKATFVVMCPGWLDTDMGNSSGNKPPISVQEGVKKILHQVYNINEDKNGHFINREGKEIAW